MDSLGFTEPTPMHFHGLVRKFLLRGGEFMRFVGHGDMTVATGPVGTAEARIGQANERAQDDDSEGQYDRDFDQIAVHA